MIQQIEYDSNDVEEFLKIHSSSLENKDSTTLQRLLSVQKKISIIANIDPIDLRTIINDLKFIKYAYKDYIITEDEISENIFFILSGECHIFSHNKKVGVLKAGATFGETAAIFNTKRNASVICASKEMTVLSFAIKHDAIEFCAHSMALLYKNLAAQINTKLELMNEKSTKK